MAKKSTTNIQTARETGLPRKRAALGDVSNVNKGDFVEVKEGKKPLGGGLLSKAAHPTGIQKSTTTRSLLGQKDKSSTVGDLKRPASVNGVSGGVQKKRSTTSGSGRRSMRDESPAAENVEPSQDKDVKVVITETTKITTRKADGTEVEKEVKREEKVTQMLAEDKFRDEKIARDVKYAKQLTKTIHAMDEEDHGDPLMVSEYVYEILDYLRGVEPTTQPNPQYMEHQEGMEWRMRGVLIDWLLEVHTRFHLLPETFYLTVNIIDRFLSRKLVQLERLQLVGITAMFIASKYEEVLSPHIGNFRHVADDGFTEAEILSAERFILSTLNYDLSYPNPMHFMRRISKADNYDIQTRTVAKYLLEMTLLDHRFLEFKPSEGAAASMHLARMILGKGDWVGFILLYCCSHY